MEFTLTPSPFYYQLFFITAFIVAYLIIIVNLKLRNQLNSQYLAASTLVFLSFVIGCKLITLMDYYSYPTDYSHISLLGQMALGGVLLSFLTLLLLRKFLQLDYRFLDSYGYAILAGFALQKPGCLLGGCCYGVGNSFVSVTYGSGSFYTALPLYESVAYLIVLLAILLPFKYYFKPGSKYYFSIAAFSLIQFAAEFLKADQQTIAFAQHFLGFKVVQWFYLGLMFASLYGLYVNEHRRSKNIDEINGPVAVWRTTAVLLLTILLLFVFRNLLYRIEVYAINIALIPALGYCFIRIYQTITIPKYRIATLFLSIIPLFLMSQSVNKRDTVSYSYHSVGIGFKTGDAHNRIVFDTEPDNCGGITNANEFDHEFTLVGAGYSRAQVNKVNKRINKLEYGVNASFGKHLETRLFDNPGTSEYMIFDINPFVKLDSRWVGAKFGFHVGNLSRFLTKRVYYGTTMPTTGSKETPFIPQFSVRVGAVEYFFLEYNYGSHFISPLPDIPQDFVLGSGFGLTNGFFVKYGFAISSEESMYISSYIPIKDSFVIEPLFRFRNGNTIMLGVHYRFGYKPLKDKVRMLE